ncbi:hypothetical protein GQ43DRAFT_371721 [Delitschia confertaspora ATCC 74209]|uniref:Ribosomal protein bL31m N-terminal domain-containing protein n=1 Tax=Delitschia confertaspora ATCC 74209 TaxID=1513339 RepID=A0A9P4MQ21_9PLEO|nr:hypothetical protein GQ43DRAFT_371721 [Delitschia confertaspora ATCC 74209]
MANPIPSTGALRALRAATQQSHLTHSHIPSTQIRHATLLRRPKRPYTFTQLVTLSDGSTFLQRTTSPVPVYKSTKDIMNTATWNPSSQKLLNVEEDEAGRLRAFREKFGRGWDAEGANEQPADHLLDLISGYGPNGVEKSTKAEGKKPAPAPGKGKK